MTTTYKQYLRRKQNYLLSCNWNGSPVKASGNTSRAGVWQESAGLQICSDPSGLGWLDKTKQSAAQHTTEWGLTPGGKKTDRGTGKSKASYFLNAQMFTSWPSSLLRSGKQGAYNKVQTNQLLSAVLVQWIFKHVVIKPNIYAGQFLNRMGTVWEQMPRCCLVERG